MLYKEYRNYIDDDIKSKCVSLLGYLVKFNNSVKDEKNSSVSGGTSHKYYFEENTQRNRYDISEKKKMLHNSILSNMQLLSNISKFKDDEIYKALYDDLIEMKLDLYAILLTDELVQENIYNLDIDKTLMENFVLECREYKTKLDSMCMI